MKRPLSSIKNNEMRFLSLSVFAGFLLPIKGLGRSVNILCKKTVISVTSSNKNSVRFKHD